jgi:hypothetical protein
MNQEQQSLSERRLSLLECIAEAADEIKRINNRIYLLQNEQQEQ